MIRDPSDGTVKKITPKPNKTKVEYAKCRSEEISSSGLPTDKIDAKELARLEKARAWVRDYIHRKPVQSTAESTEMGLRSPNHGET